MRHYQAGGPVSLKADASPLTEADRAAHDLILSELHALAPEVPVISEESSPETLAGPLPPLRFWLVDPLDGTKEFLKKTQEFTVNIALVHEREPVLGVVHAPALALAYFAEKGQPAYKQQGDASPEIIRTRRPHSDPLRVVASKDHAGPQVGEMLAKLGAGTQLISMGSALKFCLVAEGRADLYPRFVGTMEWDTAAAQCVVESAGGAVLTLDGQRLNYAKTTLTNGPLIVVGDTGLPWKKYL